VRTARAKGVSERRVVLRHQLRNALLSFITRFGLAFPFLLTGAVLIETITKGDYQAYIWSNQTGPDPLATLKCYHSKTPRTACNYVQFSNPAYDKLIDDAGQTDDMAKRNELLKQANAMLYEEAPVWFFNYNKAVMAYQPWVKGLQANATELAHQYGEDLWVDETSPAAN